MSVVVLVLLIALIIAVVGMLGAMFVKDKSFYGAIALAILTIPASMLSLVYASLVA